MPGAGEARDRWGNRWSFVAAAIGSAIGLGNFWRFPYLTYRWGGGTFLIPYLLSLFFVAIPLLLLELGLGQLMQRGNVGSFSRIHPRLRGVGLAAVVATFVIVSFYAVIISWACIYLVQSFFVPLPWSPAGDPPPNTTACQAAFGGNAAAYHLFHTVLHHYDDQCGLADASLGGMRGFSGTVFLATAAVWAMCVFCVCRGVKTAGYVVWITMPLPFLLLLILLIRALTLDGASDGVYAYLGRWDLSLLNDPGIWADACGQIFFSLGVCLGVMVSYGSYNDSDAPITLNAFTIAITNSTFSFFCGFAVFGILGHVAKVKGVSVDDVATSGLTLAFIAYPSALVELPGSNFWCIALFATLFFLGIDSAFSMLEAVTTVICDADVRGVTLDVLLERRLGRWAAGRGKPLVTGLVSAAGLLFGVLFAADVGLYWLDVMDHYVNTYTIMVNGLLEAVAVSWCWGYREDCRTVGRRAARWFGGAFFAALATFIALSTSLGSRLSSCVPTAWEVAGAAYECGPSDRDHCTFWEQVVQGVPHYAALGTVWTRCPGHEAWGIAGNQSVTFVPVAVAVGCVTPTAESCAVGAEVAVGLVAAVAVLFFGWMASWASSGVSVGRWFPAVALSGPQNLMQHIAYVDRDRVTGVPLGSGTKLVDFFGSIYCLLWCFLVKYVVPVVLSLLLVRVFKKEVATPYNGYPAYMHVVSWALVAFAFVLVAAFAVLPGAPPAPADAEDPDPTAGAKGEATVSPRRPPKANVGDGHPIAPAALLLPLGEPSPATAFLQRPGKGAAPLRSDDQHWEAEEGPDSDGRPHVFQPVRDRSGSSLSEANSDHPV